MKFLTAYINAFKKSGGLFLRERKRQLWKSYHADKLKQFENIHEGEDCFIMGNGPSLNKTNLEALNDYHVFGLNKIYMIFKRVNLDLSYHVAVNPFVIEQSIKEFETLDCPSFLAYNATNKIADSDANNISYVKEAEATKFHKDITEGVCFGYTVTFVAMQLAYYMGFKRVFLVGVDHNFKQQGDPNATQKMEEDDANHFDPNYFKGNKWQLADLKNSEISYFKAKKNFEEDHRMIFDATIGGKLDIFKKIDFDEALRIAKPKRKKTPSYAESSKG